MAKKKSDEPARGAGDNILGPAGAEHLRGLEGRIMSLMNDKDDIAAEIKGVFEEAKDAGFDTKALRKAITRKRLMDKDEAKFKADEDALDLYFATLYQGTLPGFEPLNPGLAENKKKTAKAPKIVVPALAVSDPGGPTADETAFG